ncbi:hypothetical protein Acsp05_47300 [Actinokineospora sp. NBRC 105648]|nr:hypothetical protein Acsp05_47300 [Actinokineospora sp. NBRC 105648]
MAGNPAPSPMANASGTVPTIAPSGAAAAITRNTILGVVRVLRNPTWALSISYSRHLPTHWWRKRERAG